jgi:hypothetical protein
MLFYGRLPSDNPDTVDCLFLSARKFLQSRCSETAVLYLSIAQQRLYMLQYGIVYSKEVDRELQRPCSRFLNRIYENNIGYAPFQNVAELKLLGTVITSQICGHIHEKNENRINSIILHRTSFLQKLG